MILALDTGGSYLSELGGKSRDAAYTFLTKRTTQNFTTALHSSYPASPNTSWLQHPKQKLHHYSTAAKTTFPSKSPLKKWDTPNQPLRLSPLIIQRPSGSHSKP
eukprot:CCRYP_012626-RB/>CCRYP_012626-RB protein AED:0.41 eAED:0.41 QI:0/-1/0/1/-1/0/1/0/103